MIQLLGTLMVYVTAMSIPAAVILAVIYKTKKTERVSEFMLEHMSAIKLLNAVLFLSYANLLYCRQHSVISLRSA